jgi:hypothetical protein
MGKLHNRKKHITMREIELFIEEKVSKQELESLKNKYKAELISNKNIILEQKNIYLLMFLKWNFLNIINILMNKMNFLKY